MTGSPRLALAGVGLDTVDEHRVQASRARRFHTPAHRIALTVRDAGTTTAHDTRYTMRATKHGRVTFSRRD